MEGLSALHALDVSAMKHKLLILLILPLAAFAGDLPEESQELVDKLAEYETEQLKEAQSRIHEKRAAVVVVLQQHMETATKRGDLDTALSLKEQIESLTPPAIEASETTDSPESGSIVGTVWRIETPTKELVCEFLSDTEVNWDGGLHIWQRAEDGGIEVALTEPQFGKSFRLDLDLAKGEGTHTNRRTRTEHKAKLDRRASKPQRR